MKGIQKTLTSILPGLVLLVLTACGSGIPAMTDPVPGRTAAAEDATRTSVCCTAVPDDKPATPIPSGSSSDALPYRGNTQRTGVYEFPRGPRHLYALDAATGAELWTFETTSAFLPAPAPGDGVIYITSSGDVIALK